ncbi:MAG: aspartate/glutamate racemase family protein [Alphaproteobacteria bacterium]|nr:aspartate/glutamate racemase family protein [Alphaproteobacteria bacterium]
MTDAGAPRIALIHAVTVAVDPIHEAFERLWPEADTVNLLDDSLSGDRARDRELTDAMSARIGALGDYALRLGADAVLYTCSAFGPAIEATAARLPVPVLKPNEAMFGAALAQGRRLGMLATFGPSVASMEAEFEDERRRLGVEASLSTILVEDAMTALKAGDPDTHNRLLAAQAGTLSSCDAIMLAHFSTSRAKAAVAGEVPCPVLTSPDASVTALRARMG